MAQMSQQSSSSTRTQSFCDSLRVERADSSNGTFSGSGPFELETSHHGLGASQFQFGNQIPSYLEHNSMGYFDFDDLGNTLPVTYNAMLSTPEEMDSVYLYDALLDVSPQYVASNASPNHGGDAQYSEPWDLDMDTGAQGSIGHLGTLVHLKGMPGASEFDSPATAMAGLGPCRIPWEQRPPTSPSQSSRATGSLSLSVAMDFSRSNSMTYPVPSTMSDSVKRPLVDAHSNLVAGKPLAPEKRTVIEKNAKASTRAIKSPNTYRNPTPPPRTKFSMASTADDEFSSASHEFEETSLTNKGHWLQPNPTLLQNKQGIQGSQRQRSRQAATKCRQKTKAAIAQLEATERAMTLEHMELSKTVSELRREVLILKNELLLHSDCDCDFIQQYLKDAARSIGGGGSLNYKSSQGNIASWTTASLSSHYKLLI